VSTIGTSAFRGCTNLDSIDFKNVSTIGTSTFQGCTNLYSIDFKNVSTIGTSAFEACINLDSIDFKNVSTIGLSAFEGCTNLYSIDFKNVSQIRTLAFAGCVNLRMYLMFSPALTVLDTKAFKGAGILSLDFSKTSLSTIQTDTFQNCTSLTSIQGVNSITVIDNGAFTNCTSLNTDFLNFTALTKIGQAAFESTACKIVDFSNTQITSIDVNVFSNCPQLTTLLGMSNITAINQKAFYNCPRLSVDFNNFSKLAAIAAQAFYLCTSMTYDIMLPNSLTNIVINSFDPTAKLFFKNKVGDTVSLTVDALVAVSKIVLPEAFSFNETTGLITGSIDGYGDHIVSLTNDLNDTITINFFVASEEIACFLSSSKILMKDYSYREIKDVKKGDFVISAFTKKEKEVAHCGRKTIKSISIEKTNFPVIIPKNFFGKDTPFEDVILSGHHRILVNAGDRILGVPAYKFGLCFKKSPCDFVEYFHIELNSESTDAVVSSGVAVEALEHGDWEKIGFIENT
jgi:hypothetical protein